MIYEYEFYCPECQDEGCEKCVNIEEGHIDISKLLTRVEDLAEVFDEIEKTEMGDKY